MDNLRDLKTHAGCRLNERFNQPPQICSSVLLSIFDLENYRLPLSLSFSFVLVVSIFFQSTNQLEKNQTYADDHGREIEHLIVKGHCPVET
jgi:hypothetical protein